MTQEEKDLLLKDLCARLRCGVIIQLPELFTPSVLIDEKLKSIDDCYINDSGMPIETVKPYLRPMSSMTNEERLEFSKLLDRRYCEEDWEGHISTSYCIEIDNVYTDDEGIIKYPSSFSMDAIDWLNAHHFDYRGLIPMGLALEAPKDMYA